MNSEEEKTEEKEEKEEKEKGTKEEVVKPPSKTPFDSIIKLSIAISILLVSLSNIILLYIFLTFERKEEDCKS